MWYARKSEDAAVSSHAHEATHDDEAIEAEEEDHREDAAEPCAGTSVPLPTATGATRASVEQLSSIAVSPKDDATAATTEPPAAMAQFEEDVQARTKGTERTEASDPTS